MDTSSDSDNESAHSEDSGVSADYPGRWGGHHYSRTTCTITPIDVDEYERAIQREANARLREEIAWAIRVMPNGSPEEQRSLVLDSVRLTAMLFEQLHLQVASGDMSVLQQIQDDIAAQRQPLQSPEWVVQPPVRGPVEAVESSESESDSG